MKYYLAALIALLLVPGCADFDSDPTVAGPAAGTELMKARLDGVAWSAASVSARTKDGMIIVTGSSGTSSISLEFSSNPDSNGEASLFQGIYRKGDGKWSSMHVAETENVIISKFTKDEIHGTFSFSAAQGPGTLDIKTISEGSFKARF